LEVVVVDASLVAENYKLVTVVVKLFQGGGDCRAEPFPVVFIRGEALALDKSFILK